jgi:hypothetical protein
MAALFANADWNATVRLAAFTNGHGLTFAFSSKTDLIKERDKMPEGAIKFMSLLSEAKVPFAIGQLDNVPEGTFAFVVGQLVAAPMMRQQ